MEFDKRLFIAGVVDKYDRRLLENRITKEGNVIACLSKDLTILEDNKLEKTDFITKDGRFYFGLIKSLKTKGFNTLDEVTILSNFNDEIIERFKEMGGIQTLNHMASIVSLNNFDTYLENLIKSNLLNKLYLDGFNLFNEIEIKDKKIKPFDLFQKMTSEQIIDFYDMRLSGFNTGEQSDVLEDEDISFNETFLDELEEGNDVGTSYADCGLDINGDQINGLRFLSNQTLGLHKKYLMMIAGFSSVGKSTIFITIIMSLLSQGEKVLIISNEEDVRRFKIKFICWILARYNRYFKLTKSKITAGNINEEDRRQLKIAMAYFNDNFKGKVKFVGIGNTDVNIMKKKIRNAHLRQGYSAFLIDTFKISEKSMTTERQDLALVRDSRELHNLCKKYNLIGMCSVQCSERFKGNLTLGAYCLSNSKQVKEILSQLFMMRTAYPEEFDPNSKYYCSPFRLKKVDDKWIEEEYVPNPENVYVIMCIEKNRDGVDTPSNGVSYLLEFQGQYSVFKEVAQVRTKHGLIQ